MSNADLLPSLLFKINQNQLALEAAIMELTLWVERHGSAEVAGNVRGALDTISKNEEFINMTLAVLMTSDRLDIEFGRLTSSAGPWPEGANRYPFS
ncbi:hypothetical protein D3C81_1692760 [compost metagenome]